MDAFKHYGIYQPITLLLRSIQHDGTQLNPVGLGESRLAEAIEDYTYEADGRNRMRGAV